MATNPLHHDPELKGILQKLNDIQSHEFSGWRKSFLDRYETFLEDEGTEIASRKYHHYSKSVKGLARVILDVKAIVEKGDLSPHKSTVRGRYALAELSECITAVIAEQDALLPTTRQMEKECGFGKFTMGAVLLRDNFSEYRRLALCVKWLSELRIQLRRVANRQVMEELERFGVKFQSFCHIIADLGLHDTVVKCQEFVPVFDDEESTAVESFSDSTFRCTEKKGNGVAAYEDLEEEAGYEDLEEERSSDYEEETDDESVTVRTEEDISLSLPAKVPSPMATAKKGVDEESYSDHDGESDNESVTVKAEEGSCPSYLAKDSRAAMQKDVASPKAKTEDCSSDYDEETDDESVTVRTDCDGGQPFPVVARKPRQLLAGEDDEEDCDDESIAKGYDIALSASKDQRGKKERGRSNPVRSLEAVASDSSSGRPTALFPSHLESARTLQKVPKSGVKKQNMKQSKHASPKPKGAKSGVTGSSKENDPKSQQSRLCGDSPQTIGEKLSGDEAKESVEMTNPHSKLMCEDNDSSDAHYLATFPMRPGLVRGLSLEDEETKPQRQEAEYGSEDEADVPSRSLRPSNIRGMSFEDDESVPTPGTLSHHKMKQDKEKKVYRNSGSVGPYFVAGLSDNNIGLPKQEQSRPEGFGVGNESVLAGRSVDPSDQFCTLLETEDTSNPQSQGKPNPLRPSYVRGMTFEDDGACKTENAKLESSFESENNPATASLIGCGEMASDEDDDDSRRSGVEQPLRGQTRLTKSQKRDGSCNQSSRSGAEPVMSCKEPTTRSKRRAKAVQSRKDDTATSVRTRHMRSMSSGDCIEPNLPPVSDLHAGDESLRLSSPRSRVEPTDIASVPRASSISGAKKDGIVTPCPCCGRPNNEAVSVDTGLSESASLDIEEAAADIEDEGLGDDFDPSNSFHASNKAETQVAETNSQLVERRRKCYMWYARLGLPNRNQMIQRVAALPDSCDISIEDVDILPWIHGGTTLDITEMNKLFLED